MHRRCLRDMDLSAKKVRIRQNYYPQVYPQLWRTSVRSENMCGFDKARPQFRHITSSLAVIPQNTQFIHRVINNCAQMTPFDKEGGAVLRASCPVLRAQRREDGSQWDFGLSALSSPRSAKCKVQSTRCEVRSAVH